MTDEKWNNLIDMIEEKFGIAEKIEEENDEGKVYEGAIFEGPLGLMKIERVTAPLLIDKKTTYSNRAGAETKVDYVFSETETVTRVSVYKWDETGNDWQEMSGGGMFGI